MPGGGFLNKSLYLEAMEGSKFRAIRHGTGTTPVVDMIAGADR
jgi:hypothetical protein